MATKRVQLTITDQRFFDDAQNKREAVRVWSLPWKLPQYVESWDSQNERGKVWVKVPKILGNGSVELYIYYGNPSAQSESDPEAVFEFFDDFEGTVLDTSKWEEQLLNGEYSVADSVLTIDTYAWTLLMTVRGDFNNAVIETKVRQVSYSTSPSFVSVGITDATGNVGYRLVFDRDGKYWLYDYYTDQALAQSTHSQDVTQYHVATFKFTSTQMRGQLEGESELVANIGDTDQHVSIGCLYSTWEFDWVRVRKYAEQEPTVVVGEEEASDISGWLYRRKITITNPNSYDLEHFQVAIDLDGSNFDFTKANADGSDIRVAYASARYSLPYYIETWDTATPQAVIWVGIDSETKFFVELNPNNTTDESDESVMNLDEATNYSLSKFEKYA